MSEGSLEGRLLVAAPSLLDPNFARTVVLICRHSSATGAVGWILNRPTRVQVNDAVEDLETPVQRDEFLWVGGPVEGNALWVLVHGRLPRGESIGQEIAFSNDADALMGLLAVEPPDPLGARFRVVAGYAGWEAGQLEAEIAEGAWFVVPAGPGAIFTPHPEELWREMMQRAFLLAGQPHDVIKASRWN